MRLLLSLCWILGVASGQVFVAELANPKAREKFAKFLTEVQGERYLVGHVLSGVTFDPATTKTSIPSGTKEIQFLALDSARPELPLLILNKKGKLEAVAKDRILRIAVSDLRPGSPVRPILSHQTVVGLREEYLAKRDEILKLRARHEKAAKGSREDLALRRRLISDLASLARYCRSSLFSVAAVKVEEELKKERDLLRTVGERDRLLLSESSLAREPANPDLEKHGQALGRPGIKWEVWQTKHFRIVSADLVPTATIRDALISGERALESWRSRFIDPYIATDAQDPVPEGVIAEWCLVHDDAEFAGKWFETYYAGKLPTPRDRALSLLGQTDRHLRGIPLVSQWRVTPEFDLEGNVLHILGHALVDILYRKDESLREPAWLREGLSYWLSFDQLARNTVTCVAFEVSEYARAAKAEADKGELRTLRTTFESLARESGPSVDALFRVKVSEMNTGALAKAWSFTDWILQTHPDKASAMFELCAWAGSREGPIDLNKLRPGLGKIFGVDDRDDLYGRLEKDWRAWTEAADVAGK